MSLSLLIIILFPIFFIPAIMLPKNKLKVYTLSSFIGSSFFLIFFILNILIPAFNIESTIGKAFLGMFFFIDKTYLTTEEVYHISFYLTCTFFYMVLYIISFIIIKRFYIGKNPDIVKPLSRIANFLYILLFLVFTHILLSFVLIQIREIIPLRDGFLESFFNWIYIIEA